ncbi:polysaccharide deacetylase family protein [Humibacter sp. RRB41]|uniref:polysaccharide deacetylase family protein n=1 Tax=Humibacter sp. RRB41 TaxID=2919946 RepID=UPI001FAA6AE8|nr:polysaccharide deacetylase family protein [Humibacter sp. RRB41]
MQIRLGLGIRERLSPARIRDRIGAARLLVDRHALATAGRDSPRQGGRILCYHSLGQSMWGVNDVAPARFRRQIELALEAGHRFVPASEIARTGGLPGELSISFDDGPRSVLTVAAPILASYGIPFSLFVVSGWSESGLGGNALSWDEVSRVADLGAEIGNHSSTHPDFSRLSKEKAFEEIGGAGELIERRTGIRTSAFAIPWGQSGNWPPQADEAARELGYSVLYAQAEETRPPGTIARSFVTKYDSPRVFKALLDGRYDRWEEWIWSPAAQ